MLLCSVQGQRSSVHNLSQTACVRELSLQCNSRKKRYIEADLTGKVNTKDYSNMQQEKPIRRHETDFATVWYHKLIQLSQNTYILLSFTEFGQITITQRS